MTTASRALLCLVVVVCGGMAMWPAVGLAHDVATTGQLTHTPATADSSASGSYSGTVLGSWDINDDWSLDGTFGVTREELSGDPTLVRASNIYAVGLGPSYTFGDHWLFMASGTFSPKSTQLTQTTLMFDDKVPPAGAKQHDAQVHAESTSGGVMWMANYDTAGDSNWETSVAATVMWNHYGTLQKVADVQVGGKALDTATLGAACATATTKACKVLRALLRAQQDTLDQGSFGLTVTETIHEDWDAILGATYYVYSKDPNDVGVFSVATRGTGVVGPRGSRGSLEYGEGVPLSAFLFNTQVGGAWHAHGWKVALLEAIGGYVDDGGHLAATTLKVSYKFNANWKVLTSFTFQRDTDSVGTVTNGELGTLTVRYMWE